MRRWVEAPSSGRRAISSICCGISSACLSRLIPARGWMLVRRIPATIELRFADGSIETIHYFANGDKSCPKERLEVFADSRILQLDNFRKFTGFDWPKFSRMNLWRQAKGQAECAAAFVSAIEHGDVSPILFDDLLEVSRVTIEVNS